MPPLCLCMNARKARRNIGATSEDAGELAKRAAPNQAVKSRKKRRGYVAREAGEAAGPCLEEKWDEGAQLLG